MFGSASLLTAPKHLSDFTCICLLSPLEAQTHTTVTKKIKCENFYSLRLFVLLRVSKSLSLPFSHPPTFSLSSVSISLRTQTDRSSPCCFIPPPQQFPSSVWGSGFTSSPLHHSTSLLPPCMFLPPLPLFTTPSSSGFKGPGVMQRLNSSLSQSDSLVSLPGVKSV